MYHVCRVYILFCRCIYSKTPMSDNLSWATNPPQRHPKNYLLIYIINDSYRATLFSSDNDNLFLWFYTINITPQQTTINLNLYMKLVSLKKFATNQNGLVLYVRLLNSEGILQKNILQCTMLKTKTTDCM